MFMLFHNLHNFRKINDFVLLLIISLLATQKFNKKITKNPNIKYKMVRVLCAIFTLNFEFLHLKARTGLNKLIVNENLITKSIIVIHVS